MNDIMIQSLEKLFYKKIMLYNDLLHYFKKEREALINIDLDKLWGISKGKEKICLKIQSVRQEIMDTIVAPQIDQESFHLRQILDLIRGKTGPNFKSFTAR